MKNSFLDYYKMVLEKVSFDQQLFQKELAKAIKSVEDHELEDLFQWMSSRGLAPQKFKFEPIKSRIKRRDHLISWHDNNAG